MNLTERLSCAIGQNCYVVISQIFVKLRNFLLGEHSTRYNKKLYSWWPHQMETFSVLLVLCAGNSPVSDEFPSFFDLHLNKQLSSNGEAGNLRRHGAHYDVLVMYYKIRSTRYLLEVQWPQWSSQVDIVLELKRLNDNKYRAGDVYKLSVRTISEYL